MDAVLQVNHLSKSFGSHEVLRDIDFTVKKGDVTSIIGASGSGKSTLLRCINLLETPSKGEIFFHGENVAARGVNPTAYRSKVGMVFQNFNLFSNMTVLQNCMVGQTKVLKRQEKDAKETALQFLHKVGMTPSPVPWPWTRRCSSSTNPPPPWTRRWWERCSPSCAAWRGRASPCWW